MTMKTVQFRILLHLYAFGLHNCIIGFFFTMMAVPIHLSTSLYCVNLVFYVQLLIQPYQKTGFIHQELELIFTKHVQSLKCIFKQILAEPKSIQSHIKRDPIEKIDVSITSIAKMNIKVQQFYRDQELFSLFRIVFEFQESTPKLFLGVVPVQRYVPSRLNYKDCMYSGQLFGRN